MCQCQQSTSVNSLLVSNVLVSIVYKCQQSASVNSVHESPVCVSFLQVSIGQCPHVQIVCKSQYSVQVSIVPIVFFIIVASVKNVQVLFKWANNVQVSIVQVSRAFTIDNSYQVQVSMFRNVQVLIMRKCHQSQQCASVCKHH